MKRLILLLFIIISTSSLAALADERGLIKSKNDLTHTGNKLGAYKALIIGINDYEDKAIPDLKTAVSDAREIEKILREQYGFKTDLLLDREATHDAIYSALRDLVAESVPTDSILIYYAGHGEIDKVMGDGWWVPVDAKGGKPASYLDNTLIQKTMRSMQARHVLLISDSCYSGTLFGESRSLPPINDKYYLSMYNEKSRWGMTSGNKTPVSDRGTEGHSVFAYQLIKELTKNDKPYISSQELYTLIAPVVSNNSEQTPICKPIRDTGDMGGNFIFVSTVTKSAVERPVAMPKIEAPPMPPSASDIGDMDTVIKNRETAKRQWATWQEKMEGNYNKAKAYDGNDSLTPSEKTAIWSTFLTSFGSDNPHSTQDDEMMSYARSRKKYWANTKSSPVVPKSKAAVSAHSGTSKVTIEEIKKDEPPIDVKIIQEETKKPDENKKKGMKSPSFSF